MPFVPQLQNTIYLLIPAGHLVVNCENPRKIDLSKIEDVDADVAWNQIIEAADERDGVEAKEAIQKYLKHFPEMTYVILEEAFRGQEMGIYLIATERALAPTHTNMDLQGNLGKKFTVQYRFSSQPDRAREKAGWPASAEENMARLADAGEPVSRLMQKCNNCDELGHTAKACPQDPNEKVRVTITCYNCGEEGHRVRDCKFIRCLHQPSLTDQILRPYPSCRQVRLQELRSIWPQGLRVH